MKEALLFDLISYLSRVLVVAVLVVGATAPVDAQEARAVDEWVELAARVQLAADNQSATELRAARGDLLRILVQPSHREREVLVQYAIGYIAWRMSILPDVGARELDDLLEDAIVRLGAAVRADPENPEAHAMLGTLYGSQLGRSPERASVLGPHAITSLSRAADLGPNNPRVLLQQGISAMFTPVLYGGGVDRAEHFLRRSVQSFGEEPADSPWPNWGQWEAHAWLGQALATKGDIAGARAEYNEVLGTAPGPSLAYVRDNLLPALERSER